MTDFDEGSAWSELCSVWRWSTRSRIADEKRDGHKVWAEMVDKEALWPDIRRAVDTLNASLLDDRTYPHRLGGFLRSGWEGFVGEVSAQEASVPQTASLLPMVEPQRPSETDDDLVEVLSTWPPNPGYPEKPSAARAAWAAAVSQHGKERVLRACRAYMSWAADADSVYPKHLRTFLGDAEEVEIWSAREVPDAGEVAIFDVAWHAFPARKGAEERGSEGRVLFFRNVQPDDRLYFLAACTGYARAMVAAKRTGEDQFALGFARFTREWRTARGKEMVWDCARLVEHALWEVFDREGLDSQGYLKGGPQGISGPLVANQIGVAPLRQVVSVTLARFAAEAPRSWLVPWVVRHKERLGDGFSLEKWSLERAEEVEASVRAAIVQRAAQL
jgi:hypothetical protein